MARGEQAETRQITTVPLGTPSTPFLPAAAAADRSCEKTVYLALTIPAKPRFDPLILRPPPASSTTPAGCQHGRSDG
ncbi:hypothetical protein BST61_g183 [Cercospora zeina]